MRRDGLPTRRPSRRASSWTPADIQGLALWLDNSLVTVDGGLVTAWPDLSKYRRNFLQSNPALQPNYVELETDFPKPQAAVKFDVADSVLMVAAPFALRWVAIVAVYPATTFSGFHGLFTASAANDQRALVGSSGTANWLTDGIAGNRFRDGIDTDIALTTENTPHLYIHTFNAAQNWTWQVGKDRGNAGRQWTDSVCLVVGGDSPISSDDAANLLDYSRYRGMLT